jgi:hypothetical protein
VSSFFGKPATYRSEIYNCRKHAFILLTLRLRVKWGVESRTGAVALVSRWLLTKLSRRRLSPV